MRNVTRLAAVAAAVVVLACVADVQAEVTIETLLVRNPGNAGELSGDGAGGIGPDRVCGAVDYVYRIGKFEITASQYTEFLNAVASDDTYGLYNFGMWGEDSGCKIEIGGVPGHAIYSVAADWADRPVNLVSWGDAARFCNWLHNGQPTGAQDLTTTEDGSYYLNGATTGPELMAVVREPDATWAIPSEDEWYKAAYHYNDGVTGSYYDYPMSADAIPNNGNPGGDTGNSANFWYGNHTIGAPYWRTEVGFFGLSQSPYGTFDQGGNVSEWNETVTDDSYRGVRGGQFNDNYFMLYAASRLYGDPTGESISRGFRLAKVYERSVAIQTVTVGNPGNGPDDEVMNDGTTGYGRVDYVYKIGKFEVTAGQYTAFLNAVAAEDTYGLYHTHMAEPVAAHGCNIQRSGSPGSYTYTVTAEWTDRPVNYVTWDDAARFCNWLHNGQPAGMQNLTTTEDGSYHVNGATSDAALLAVVREPDATWVIPSEDEWYKAAFHLNDGATGNFFDYPMSSNNDPSNDLIDPDPGNNANFRDDEYAIGPPYWRTVIGEFENSKSPYDTFDQGGNVWEWTEAVIGGSYRGVRGGAYVSYDFYLHASYRWYGPPGTLLGSFGFRVAKVSWPSPDIPTVTVGNPGNAGEWSGQSYGGNGPDRLCGAVPYVYSIGKFEVTAGQYTEFLNAVASDDTYGLYSTSMWYSDDGCKIERNGSPGSYIYTVATEWADRPVNFVSWGDAARFANWMRNGKPSGVQDLTTTEDGSYYLNGAMENSELQAVARAPDATWVIPSEDEWYKAAYHKGDGVTGNYWDYPTGTNAVPNNGNPEGDTGNSATFNDGDYTIGSPHWRTEVGYFGLSGGPYGTFDQGGNVWEWIEAVLFTTSRGIRGGSYGNSSNTLRAAARSGTWNPSMGGNTIGFRLAQRQVCVPPSSPQEDPTCPPEGCESGGCGAKSRYVSFYGANPGILTAVRVRFVSLSGYEYAENRTMWVQEPYLVTEASGSSDPVPPPTMWAATLDCDPFYTDWSAYDVVDVFDAAIVPHGAYEIQLIRQGDPALEQCYSNPLIVHLSELGDVVGSRTTPPPQSPPECDCNFNDISACVDKFKNEPTAPRKARADLVNASIEQPKPDQKNDFIDITCAVECFRGTPCSHPDWGPPEDDPCQ